MEKEVQAGALEVIPAEDARLMFCAYKFQDQLQLF